MEYEYDLITVYKLVEDKEIEVFKGTIIETLDFIQCETKDKCTTTVDYTTNKQYFKCEDGTIFVTDSIVFELVYGD